MPRINDTILDCVVYLYRSRDAAASGVAAGGSGFLLKIDTTRVPHSHFNVVVTNRHVGEKGHVVRLNTKEGKTEIVEVSKDRVFMSDKDDSAVILMPTIPEAYQINSIPRGCLVTEEFIQQHGIGIGDEVLMLGRFINRQGTQRNAPTARFGHISQMMGDPIKCDVDGNEVEQDDAILAEIKSIGGYSGSPVFVLPNRTYVRPGEPLD